ncbi:MAG TPA: TlpA family protein disulfide reductase [Aurantimonas coralicida]|uniref:Thioredoxin domain-containing protein n=1 Tax=marine sediment metagenome TaxID=412755 RepID=A0A0F9XQ60_9ZZZZ|nr:TlpA family protein disulfide reductase [Aurantimonas coralicida]
MSEETRQASNGRRLGVIAGIALISGIAAGGVVLYVSETGSGNEVAATSCPADEAIYAAIDGAARGEVAAVQALDAPFDISAMAFTDGDGQPASLKDFSGKTLLVNLWATWCVPCRLEMPALDALEQQEGGEDFAVIPINIDTGSIDKPKKFYAETKLTALPLYRDETMGVFDDLKGRGLAYGLPVSVLVGPDGCARAAINGPAEWASPDAVKLIEAVKESGRKV